MLRQQCKQKTFFSFFLRSWWTPQPPKNVSAINLSSHAGFSFIFILMSPPPPHPPDDDDVVVVVPIMSLTIMNEYQYESIFISLASLVLLWSLTYFSLSLSLSDDDEWWMMIWWMDIYELRPLPLCCYASYFAYVNCLMLISIFFIFFYMVKRTLAKKNIIASLYYSVYL